MENLELYLYVFCTIYTIIGYFAFKEQRTELELGREIGFDIRKLILPMWCVITAHLSWVLIAISIYIMYEYSVINGIIILFINFILIGLIPFPTSDKTNAYKLLAKYLDKNEINMQQNVNTDALRLMMALQVNNTYEEVKKYRNLTPKN